LTLTYWGILLDVSEPMVARFRQADVSDLIMGVGRCELTEERALHRPGHANTITVDDPAPDSPATWKWCASGADLTWMWYLVCVGAPATPIMVATPRSARR